MTDEEMAELGKAMRRVDCFHLPEAVDHLIDMDKEFPTVFRIRRVLEHLDKGERIRQQASGRILAAQAGSVRCLDCGDSGWVRMDVMPGHVDFGKTIRCPKCDGESNVGHNTHAAVLWHVAVEHERRGRGDESVYYERPAKPDPPPENFASPRLDLIPKTETEEAAGRRKAQLAREVAALRDRMNM